MHQKNGYKTTRMQLRILRTQAECSILRDSIASMQLSLAGRQLTEIPFVQTASQMGHLDLSHNSLRYAFLSMIAS
jgi:hypothetical protein